LPDGSELKVEYLETQTLGGMQVAGCRETRTFPAGRQGRDRPLVLARETWISPRLPGVAVLQKLRATNGAGDTTETLIHVSFGEAALSLFQPPPDFTAIEVTGPYLSIPIHAPPARP
jgi:hypothetical protein